MSSSNNNGIQVVVRLRPLNDREKKHGTLPVVSASTSEKTVTVIKSSSHSRQQSQQSSSRLVFAFDTVFTAFSTQQEVFHTTMKPILKDVLKGFESTVFAYGQTGTGKTHTMEGSSIVPEQYGVIPRSAQAIFEELNKKELQYESYRILCSYLEIYNEELCDLLADCKPTAQNGAEESSSAQQPLSIMEGKKGPFCRGLSQIEVKTAADLLALMQSAQQSRRVGETNMNKQSSRSHCIFTLSVHAKRRFPDGSLLETRGKLHLVDLAGSECAKSASLDNSHHQVARDRERMNINRSLLTLGRVVNMLKEQKQNVRIPYRDSKLTRILQQALGGNSKTVIIATLSPSVTAMEESISTLNYAQAAQGIINKPVSASYMSQSSTSPTANGAANNAGHASIEKWSEMEMRLEYMEAQVEEAKAALARKHLQQQELVDRATAAEKAKLAFEQRYQTLQVQQAQLTQELAATQETCRQTQEELGETKKTLEKTTVLLQATQETEVRLTQQAKALLAALQKAVAVGEDLYSLVLKNRDTDVERRRTAQQFQTSIHSLLVTVQEALAGLTQQETSHCSAIKALAAVAQDKEWKFVQHATTVLQNALASVESAVATWKSSLASEMVPTAERLVKDTFKKVGKSCVILEQAEDVLGDGFQSAREQIAQLGARLTELEHTQETLAGQAISVLQDHVAFSKSKTDQLVASTCAALDTAQRNRQQIRNATKETIEQWKVSLMESGTVIFNESSSQRKVVEQTLERMNTEMQHHESMESYLADQTRLLQQGHDATTESHNAQKLLLLQTQDAVAASHKQQTQLLSAFVGNLMKGVESLVQAQVAKVVDETNKGHGQFLERNALLVNNHATLTSTTQETLQAASTLASNIQQEAGEAKENDVRVLSQLGETKSVLATIQSTAEGQNASVDKFASQASQHLQDAENLNAEDKRVLEELTSGGKECVDHMAGELLRETSAGILALGKAGKSVSDFTRTDVLESMSLAVTEMEKPRDEMMATFTRECSELKKDMEKSLAVIKKKASDSSKGADSLYDEINSLATEFKNGAAKNREIEIAQTKDAFLNSAADHLSNASQRIAASHDGSTKAAAATDTFVRCDLHAYDEVEKPPEHTPISFSENLSSTPSASELTGNVGKVLQDLSRNEESSVRPSKKVHPRPNGNMAENTVAYKRSESFS